MSLLSKTQRDQAKLARKLVKNGSLAMHIGSVAIAVEALEALLVEKGILQDDELMERIKAVTQKHYAAGEFIPPVED